MYIRERAKREAARWRSCQVFAAQLLATQAQKNTRADTKKNFYPTPRVMTLTAVEPSLCTVVLGYRTAVGTVP